MIRGMQKTDFVEPDEVEPNATNKVLTKGTVVKVQGIPCELLADTPVIGDVKLAIAEPKESPAIT
jgi:hypothetical protein